MKIVDNSKYLIYNEVILTCTPPPHIPSLYVRNKHILRNPLKGQNHVWGKGKWREDFQKQVNQNVRLSEELRQIRLGFAWHRSQDGGLSIRGRERENFFILVCKFTTASIICKSRLWESLLDNYYPFWMINTLE